MDVSPDFVRQHRLAAQRLHPRALSGSLVEAVGQVCGLQAQLPSAMQLAARVRVSGLLQSEMEDAIRSRVLIRTWAMRSTLHLLPAADVAWMVWLLGPKMAARGRRRRLELGLTDELCDAALPVIQDILRQESPLTRWELVDRLAARRVPVPRQGQAPFHLIQYAALQGVLSLGPDRRDGQATYVPLEPDPAVAHLRQDEALAELARRYLRGYGPASVRDFASWSGLPLSDARRAWAALQEDGRASYRQARIPSSAAPLWMEATDAEEADRGPGSLQVRLLAAFDPYLLGYADREEVVRQGDQSQVYHGGQVVPVVLADGLAVGTWRYERRGKRLEVTVRLFSSTVSERLGSRTEQLEAGIEAEVQDIGRFLGIPATVAIA
ncbi:MAG: winged helix DNA-binding domain-containing protein [Anaerolineae bacterium]|jgi:hypothetical protein